MADTQHRRDPNKGFNRAFLVCIVVAILVVMACFYVLSSKRQARVQPGDTPSTPSHPSMLVVPGRRAVA